MITWSLTYSVRRNPIFITAPPPQDANLLVKHVGQDSHYTESIK